MLQDLALGKEVLTAIGLALSESDQMAVSQYRHKAPEFIKSQAGQEAVRLLMSSFIQHVEKSK